MKDKDVKKLLSDGAKQVLPDDNVKRDIAFRLSLDEGEKVAALVGGGTRGRARKKPVIIAVTFAVIVAVLCAVLISYYMKNDETPVIPSPIDKFTSIDGADDFYAYGAASVGALLSAQTESGAAAIKAAAKLTASTADEVADLLDGYMPLVEGLLGDGGITCEADENYSEYQYKLVIGYPHLDGEYSTYVLYYNRTSSEIKTEDGETEEKYDIEGVLSVNGVDYYVVGEHEYETEDGETEEQFTFTAYEDGQPFIKLEQEIEQEDGESEVAYLYTFYSGGEATKSVEVEYEQEDGETELKLVIKEGASTSRFVFTLIDDEKMTVKATVNGARYTITVTVADGKYYYTVK